MGSGDEPYLWVDHDRWVREVYVLHQQEDLMAHADWRKGQDKLEGWLIKFAIGFGTTMFLLLGTTAANLWIALAHRG